jgi:hypothetical protein
MPSPAPPNGFLSTDPTFQTRLVLRLLGAAMLAAGMLPLAGCAGPGMFRLRSPNHQLSAATRPRFSDDPQIEEVVDHLNRNVDKLQAWQADSVRIRANNLPLSGSLVVEEGQRLRLIVNSIAGHEVDMGSNDEVFWIWAKRMDPAYVYCRHEQIEVARQTLGVPFEPQWLMQALGVAPLEIRDLEMQIDPATRQARLVQPMFSAHGQPMQKVMIVDLVDGVITEHCIYNARGQKIAQAKLEDFRVDKETGVILAHRVKLDWPQNQMSLVMNLGHVDINPSSIPGQIWEMPEMRGVQVVDLGRSAEPGVRIAGAVSEREFRVRESNELPSDDLPADDDAGRVRLSLEDNDEESEIPFDRPFADDRADARAIDPIEYQTAPIERPVNREWFDE